MLQGCAGAMLAAGVAGMATVEVTGKSASDHIISAVNGQDCKMARKMQGEEMCKDEEPKKASTVATVPEKVRAVGSSSVTRANDVFAQRAKGKYESN